MNERIENCLYQAGLTAQGCWDELDDYARQGIEKFAELIVQECAKVCDEMEKKAEEYGAECCKWPTPHDCAIAIRAWGNT